ncbi:hypothetical protein PLICRDRAFT_179876 [Plicaturopsis crispa FD-325 SS-3]|uniref:Uncharacterized protein n=1 Tax=Plicaturopsis crispa FD-325 SS-3 TaxID=944288 RepID=A0A0C9SX96_PLICR|nr:hypothetical protein PLICRDRAFT_179876 [Plicaturopsis crispa FD-325 SS-3]
MAKSKTRKSARLLSKPYNRTPSPPSGSGSAAASGPSGSKTILTSSPSLKDVLSASTPNSGDTFPKDIRGCFLEVCQRMNPQLQPRSGEMRDWDIQMIATIKTSGIDANNFAAWSDSKLENLYRDLLPEEKPRRREEILRSMKQLLDGPPEAVGRKPRPGEGDIHIRKIPDSEYSFRLWGRGLDATHKYCLDWVHSQTGEPVNSPFGEDYELWAVPNRRTPWIPCPTSRLCSAERAFGVAQKDILPGQEKFILLEGTACLFKRPGKQPIYFEVPVRPRQDDTNQDVLVLDFTGKD